MSENDGLTGRWLTKTVVGGFIASVIALAAAAFYGVAVDAVDGPPLTVELLGHPFDNEAPPLWTSALVTNPERGIEDLPGEAAAGSSWGYITWDWSDVAVYSEKIRLALRSNAEAPVLIERFEPRILNRTEPLTGWFIADGGCGGIPVRQGLIDFDAARPRVVFDHGDGDAELALFVHAGVMEVVQLQAVTDAHFVEWELDIHYSSENGPGVVTVRRATGGPFRVSSGVGSKAYVPWWNEKKFHRAPDWDNGISIC